MAEVLLRGTGPDGEAVERRLAVGDEWHVGDPTVARLRSLGEGLLFVEALRDGVVIDGRPELSRRIVDLGAMDATLDLGAMLLTAALLDSASAATEPEPSDPTAASLAPLAFEEDGLPAPSSTQPNRHPAPPRGPRPTRRPRSRRNRLPTSVTASLVVHGILLGLLALLLLTNPSPPRERPFRYQVAFRSPLVDVPPEAHMGSRETPDPEESGESGTDADRSAPLDLSNFAAQLEAEVGPAADEKAESTDLGVGGVPAGTLLAARIGGRERLLREGGGNAAADGALLLALRWLSDHQGIDGAWGATGFSAMCDVGDRCEGHGERQYREAATGLALLPFLGAGHTHHDGPWRDTIRDGLAALLRDQKSDGSFASDGKRVYASAICSLALCEAYGLTGSAVLREPAQRSIDYFVKRQSERGGWRYRPGDGTSDASVTGWVVMALSAAQRAKLRVPAHTLAGCRRLLAARTDSDGDVGYLARGQGTDALLGVGLYSRIALGADPASDEMRRIGYRLSSTSPRWEDGEPGSGYGAGDPTHWYYGSLAAFQMGHWIWDGWNESLRPMLLQNQVRTGCATGSWPPRGRTGARGGRLVTTALNALSLEVMYRYPRVAR